MLVDPLIPLMCQTLVNELVKNEGLQRKERYIYKCYAMIQAEREQNLYNLSRRRHLTKP